MNGFYEWMTDILPYAIPGLKFEQAISYGLSSWEHMKNYIECPEAYIDNSIPVKNICNIKETLYL